MTSSRYTIREPTETYGAVAFGWDAVGETFYVQWFKKTNDDDAPAVWLPRLTSVEQVQQNFAQVGAALPDLARRVLLADQHDGPIDLAVGDIVHRGAARGTIGELSSGIAQVAFDNGTVDSHRVDDLMPDLVSVGVL